VQLTDTAAGKAVFVIDMTKWHLRSNRKSTGGVLKKNSKKKKFQGGSEFLETKIAERKTKISRSLGGGSKIKLLSVSKANIMNPKTGKCQMAKIETVTQNPANPHYSRRNIITKGAIIRTDIGMARVTSRPGQHGVLNAVLIEEKK
jgi:small subunit ribosomal protein S8e